MGINPHLDKNLDTNTVLFHAGTVKENTGKKGYTAFIEMQYNLNGQEGKKVFAIHGFKTKEKAQAATMNFREGVKKSFVEYLKLHNPDQSINIIQRNNKQEVVTSVINKDYKEKFKINLKNSTLKNLTKDVSDIIQGKSTSKSRSFHTRLQDVIKNSQHVKNAWFRRDNSASNKEISEKRNNELESMKNRGEENRPEIPRTQHHEKQNFVGTNIPAPPPAPPLKQPSNPSSVKVKSQDQSHIPALPPAPPLKQPSNPSSAKVKSQDQSHIPAPPPAPPLKQPSNPSSAKVKSQDQSHIPAPPPPPPPQIKNTTNVSSKPSSSTKQETPSAPPAPSFSSSEKKSVNTSREAFLDEIKKGKTLTPTEKKNFGKDKNNDGVKTVDVPLTDSEGKVTKKSVRVFTINGIQVSEQVYKLAMMKQEENVSNEDDGAWTNEWDDDEPSSPLPPNNVREASKENDLEETKSIKKEIPIKTPIENPSTTLNEEKKAKVLQSIKNAKNKEMNRNDLLNSIQKGTSLRKVAPKENRNKAVNEVTSRITSRREAIEGTKKKRSQKKEEEDFWDNTNINE